LTPGQSGELLVFLLLNAEQIQQLCVEDRLKYKAGIRALLDILYEIQEKDKLKTNLSSS
jgi:hypothetical protein